MKIIVTLAYDGTYSAIEEDTYDGGDPESEIGWGKTELEAVEDLLFQLKENATNEESNEQ